MLYNASVEMYLEEVCETTSAKDLHLHAEQEGYKISISWPRSLKSCGVYLSRIYTVTRFIEVKEWTREKSIIDKTS